MNKERFEYRYEFANGDVKEFSITTTNGLSREEMRKWIPLLKEMDRLDYNNEKRETRRHCSLDAFNADGNLFESTHDGFERYREKVFWGELREHLTEREMLVCELFHRQGFSKEEIADVLNVSVSRIYALLAAVRKKVKKFGAAI